MIKVECDGCKAPYQVEEKRIPASGLKMRCPKCGTSFVVQRPGAAPRIEADLPAPRAPRPGNAPRPMAPPPPAARAPSFEEDLLDLPANVGAPRRELAIDVDLPAVPAGPPARAPLDSIDLPVVQGPSVDEGLDLPALPFGEADLPAVLGTSPSQARMAAFGDLDLPEVPGVVGAAARPTAKTFGEIDLPAPAAPAKPGPGFGDLDLPEVPGALGAAAHPPARSFGEIDLPAPAAPVGLPSSFGDLDLPELPPAAPPVPAGRPAERSFGEIDLPLLAEDEAQPLPPLPEAQLFGAGAAREEPLAFRSRAASPPPFGKSPLDGLDEEPLSFDLDDSAAPKAPPAPPAPPPTPAAPEARAPFDSGSVGEEFSFGDVEVKSSDMGSAKAAPVEEPLFQSPEPEAEASEEALGAADAIGDEADLPSQREGAAPAPLPQPSKSSRASTTSEAAPKRPRGRKLVLAALVLLALGGGSLAFEPSIGPFGFNFISDRLNAGKHAAMLAELRRAAQADLAEDTADAVTRALGRARAAHDALPRHRPTAAYYAYLAAARGLRFGRRSADDAVAKQIVSTLGEEAGVEAALARAALDASSGGLARAGQAALAIFGRAPEDVDAAVLVGEIQLKTTPDKAKATWERAVALEKSARTLFGLARAELAAGDALGAEKSARAVIEASKRHIAARTLLASILWQRGEHDDEAIAELKKVTEDQAMRSAASESELVDAFNLLGRIHLARSRFSAAERAFAEALKLDPQAVSALIGNGELFYQAGRYSEALARFEAAERADAENVLGKVGAAKTLLALERMKEAKDRLKKLEAARPNDPRVIFWLGRTEEVLGNKKEAEAAYTKAIAKGGDKPEVVDAYVALAQMLSSQGRADDASEKLREASTRFPDHAALHRAKGEVALQSGRYEEAQKELLAALEKGEDLGARFKLGVALRRMRMFDDAAKVFDKIAEVDKEYPGLALERGLLFEETGESDRALEMYSSALKKAPDDIDLQLRVGSAQVVAGHAEQAEPILRRVLKERPASAEANHFLGRALLIKGQSLAEAMRYLETAVNVDPNRAEYHLYVGWVANETGQTAKADTALKKAIALDHELGDAYWQLGVLLQKQGAIVDALAALTTALEKRPSRHEAYATMALCYQDQQRWADAEQAWQKAIQGNGSVAEWHYRLGKIYASHGNTVAALPELEQAAKLADLPEHKPPAWLFDAHFLLGEALRGRNREQAIQHYRRYLALAPTGNAYIEDAKKTLASLGAPVEP